MDWNLLINPIRLGQENKPSHNKHNRTQFQRDYDRLIFSPAFRRLQNKTQVFPLPENILVHNRLTHSLEVASVGRSIGNLISMEMERKNALENTDFYPEIGNIVAASCLAHDIGNPPFGHSGEKAISEFFQSKTGSSYTKNLSEAEINDLTHFEGNANAFRLLTHQFKGKREGGFALTYSTLAGIVKYPFESTWQRKKAKYGFFQTEKSSYKKIAEKLGIEKKNESPLSYARHPLVYIVEAADDICYQIMDVEDAHKLGILGYDETRSILLNFLDEDGKANIEKNIGRIISDKNEIISYLRASVINSLVKQCSEIFIQNEHPIIKGEFKGSLFKNLSNETLKAYKNCNEISIQKIYNHSKVVETEIAGFRIIGTLLEELLQAVFNPKSKLSDMILRLLPTQYDFSQESDYEKILSVTDIVSSMTDPYALNLYRKITGIELPGY